MKAIATLYELLAIVVGPKLLAETSDATNHEQKPKCPDECFIDPRINKPFALNKGILIFKANLASMNNTAAMRTSNCRELLASLLRLHLRLVPERTPKRVPFRFKCLCESR